MRRIVGFVTAILLGLALGLAWGETREAPRMRAEVLLKRIVSDLPKGRGEVRLQLDTWDPGSETGEHHHSGPTMIYVLEGQLNWIERGVPKTLQAGQAFLEPAGVRHNVKNLGEKPAKAFVVHLFPVP